MGTSVFERNYTEPQSNHYDNSENKCDEVGARAKFLNSDTCYENKTPAESSSASVSNEEIWHLNDCDHENGGFKCGKSAHNITSNSYDEKIQNGISLNTNSEIFSYLEAQRVYLESRIGVDSLLKVYRLVCDLEEKLEDEKLDYSDFQKILGRGNEDLIDDIIQLVVADNFLNVDQA